jgi:hypothetical protein
LASSRARSVVRVRSENAPPCGCSVCTATLPLTSTPGNAASIAGDLGGYAPLDVPRVQAIHSGPMYHTSGDTLDTISTPGLERAARFYAHFVIEIARLDRRALQAQ